MLSHSKERESVRISESNALKKRRNLQVMTKIHTRKQKELTLPFFVFALIEDLKNLSNVYPPVEIAYIQTVEVLQTTLCLSFRL